MVATTRPKTRSTAERVAVELHQLIEQNVYRPGDRLRETELAERFGVSRAPVREALRALAARSLVHVEPMRGATVARLTDAEARESVEISAALFALAARKAATLISDGGLEKLKGCVDRMETMLGEEASPREFFLQTLRAGRVILQHCGGVRLQSLIIDVRTGAADFFGPFGCTTPTLRRAALARWRGMEAALQSRDGEAAARIAVQVHEDAMAAALKLMP